LTVAKERKPTLVADVCGICEEPATRRFIGNPGDTAILTCEADLDKATVESGQGQIEDLE